MRHFAQTDDEFAVWVTKDLELEDDELAFLLAEKGASKRVERILEAVAAEDQGPVEEDVALGGAPSRAKAGRRKKEPAAKAAKPKKAATVAEAAPAPEPEAEPETAAQPQVDGEDDGGDKPGAKKQKNLFEF